jgi:site-specific DNA-methyltransferase (adenine-specific)
MSSGSVKTIDFDEFHRQKIGLDRLNILPLDTIICGDCEDVLRAFPDNCIDLIVTSPPYADQRKKTYGGIHPDKYVDWFLPKSKEFLRVLKPDGTFVLNIKERVDDGERHTFVLELIIEMRKQGWLWTEEFIWSKKNCYPGKWPNRFRDSWERCLQFNKTKKFKMFQDTVMVPVGDWSKIRLKNLNQTDHVRDESKTNSGFGKKIDNWIGRDMVYPTNVLNIATECGHKKHSAAFPVALPEWFIKLFTAEDNVILDPFMGSGSSAVASRKNNRRFIGIDTQQEYCKQAKERVESPSEF